MPHLLLSCLFATAAAATDQRPRVLFLGVHAGPEITEADAAATEQIVTGALDETAAFQITTRRDVAALVTAEKQRQALGDDGGRLLTELATTLGVRLVVTSEFGKLGEEYVLTVTLLDADLARALGRGTRAGPRSALASHAHDVAIALAARASGEQHAMPARAATASVAPATLALWELAHQSFRDGAGVRVLLDKVIAADPTFSPAQLLQALDAPDEKIGKPALDAALAGRTRLSDVEQLEVAAAEACWRDGWSNKACEAAWREATDKLPGDAEALTHLGRALLASQQSDAAIEVFRDAQAYDPTLGRAVVGEAAAVIREADRSASEAVLQKCLTNAPRAATCLEWLATFAEHDGRAEELERVARRMISLRPDDATSHYKLALALDCRDAAPEAIRGVFEKAWARLPDASRLQYQSSDEAILAFRAGDFPKALALVDGDVDRSLATSFLDGVRSDVGVIVAAALETGDVKRARKAIERLLAKLPALEKDTRELDLVVRLELARLDGKVPSDVAKRRDESWARLAAVGAKASGKLPFLSRWVDFWAYSVRDKATAEVAIAHLAEIGDLPAVGALWSWATAMLGRTYSLAGRHAEALPYLARATALCNYDPQSSTPARLAYARSLAASNEKEAAIGQYERLLFRWAKARPKSATAAAAKKELAALSKGKRQ